MKSIVGVTLALAALASTAPLTAQASDRGHNRGWHGDIHRFAAHDLHRWRSGAWRHGPHRGRVGWWWVAGGTWYFYPRPVYPYPDPFMPPNVVIHQSAPPAAVQIPAPDSAPVQPVAQFWYFCDAAKAYYPYVASCPSGWTTVPANPQGVSP